jgi:hypothetical protein
MEQDDSGVRGEIGWLAYVTHARYGVRAANFANPRLYNPVQPESIQSSSMIYHNDLSSC